LPLLAPHSDADVIAQSAIQGEFGGPSILAFLLTSDVAFRAVTPPLVFLPASPPPPLLPTLPSLKEFSALDTSLWSATETETKLTRRFVNQGQAHAALYLPSVDSFTSGVPIPFVFTFTIEPKLALAPDGPPSDYSSFTKKLPEPRLDEFSIHVVRKVTSLARGATDKILKTFDDEGENLFTLAGETKRKWESGWKHDGTRWTWSVALGGEMVVKRTPTFSHRQLSSSVSVIAFFFLSLLFASLTLKRGLYSIFSRSAYLSPV
jgi:hypothetical protein